jgi:hypothetical protein
VLLHHFSISREQLGAIPEPERVLVVLLAHAANELSVLTKLFHFSAKARDAELVLTEASNAQALVLGRILTGKLHECWRLLERAFFASAISRDYASKFDAEASGAMDQLKKYFGRKNLIEVVRNNFAFHYSTDLVKGGYEALGVDDPLNVYLSQTNANTLYGFAETVTGRALMQAINPSDHKAAFDALILETSQAVRRLNIVIGACMHACFERHLGGDLYSLGARTISIEGAASSQEVELPYFVEVADAGDV